MYVEWVDQKLDSDALLGMVRFSENVQIIDFGPYPRAQASFEDGRELLGGQIANARGDWVTGRNIERLRGGLFRFTGYGAPSADRKGIAS